MTEKRTDPKLSTSLQSEMPNKGQNERPPRRHSIAASIGRPRPTPASQVPIRLQQSAPDFTPTHAFYIRRHAHWSTKIEVIDLTSETSVNFLEGGISGTLRDQARAIAEAPSRIDNPAYIFTRPHWWSTDVTMIKTRALPKMEAEVATFTLPRSLQRHRNIPVRFPSHSQHSEDIVFPAKSWEWWQAKYKYGWFKDSRVMHSSMTLRKFVGKRELPVAKYMQHLGGTVSGGLLLVDGGLLDEAVVILSAVALLSTERALGDKMAFGVDAKAASGIGVAGAVAVGGGC